METGNAALYQNKSLEEIDINMEEIIEDDESAEADLGIYY